MTKTKRLTGSISVTAFAVAAFVAFVVLGIGWGFYVNSASKQDQVCTVEGKDRTRDKDGKSDMRVYTTCGTFTVEDNMIQGLFDSADLYSSLHEGQTYELTVIGYRIPVLSQFPSIIEAKEQ